MTMLYATTNVVGNHGHDVDDVAQTLRTPPGLSHHPVRHSLIATDAIEIDFPSAVMLFI